MTFVEIPFDSELYRAECDLREKILRRPLGLRLSATDLEGEEAQWHFGVIHDEQLIACVVIKPLSKSLAKLRQMAVEKDYRKQGVGRFLIMSVERQLPARHITVVEMSARLTAIGFYRKLGYSDEGDVFSEVTIPHITMRKHLQVPT